jgi:hypothetical protein
MRGANPLSYFIVAAMAMVTLILSLRMALSGWSLAGEKQPESPCSDQQANDTINHADISRHRPLQDLTGRTRTTAILPAGPISKMT